MVFFFGGRACACTVLLYSKKKKKCRTKKEGAEALDWVSVSLHCGRKGGEKRLFATTVTSVVVGSTFQTLTVTFCLTRSYRIISKNAK